VKFLTQFFNEPTSDTGLSSVPSRTASHLLPLAPTNSLQKASSENNNMIIDKTNRQSNGAIKSNGNDGSVQNGSIKSNGSIIPKADNKADNKAGNKTATADNKADNKPSPRVVEESPVRGESEILKDAKLLRDKKPRKPAKTEEKTEVQTKDDTNSIEVEKKVSAKKVNGTVTRDSKNKVSGTVTRDSKNLKDNKKNHTNVTTEKKSNTVDSPLVKAIPTPLTKASGEKTSDRKSAADAKPSDKKENKSTVKKETNSIENAQDALPDDLLDDGFQMSRRKKGSNRPRSQENSKGKQEEENTVSVC
jgi:hypothetical protein